MNGSRAARRAGASARARMPGTMRALVASLVALLVLYGISLLVLRPSSSGSQLTLDAVVRAAERGEVATARFLDQDARVLGTLEAEAGGSAPRFWSSYPRSDAATNDLLKSLIANDTRVTVEAQTGKALVRFLAQFLLPLVVLANLFALLFFVTRGGTGSGSASQLLSFSRLGDRRLAHRSGTTFADVAAAEDTVVELSEVRDFLADPEAFKAMGALPPKGVLIVGPPGCGKTLLARAVAGEAHASFFSISASEFVESLVGVGAARVRDLFRQARASTPSIVFIDELDAVGRQRGAGIGGGHDEREQTLNELLVQMDGFSPREGVAVFAATNRVDILDPALLRPGRFDRHVTVERPDRDGRLAILRLHARGKRLLDADADLVHVAIRTAGFTGADLAGLLNEAALLAVRERAGAIKRDHLEEAVERIVAGPRRKATIITAEEKRRVAYHEAGHAVVAAGMGKASVIDKISVVSRGRGAGHAAILADEGLVRTLQDMESRVAIAMAGVAAEEMVLGQASTGSEHDLQQATDTARDMAGRFGMSSRLGRVRILHYDREVFLGRDYLSTRDVSQPTLEQLDAEVRRILDEQEQMARQILVTHRPVLDALAASLVTHETLQGAALEEALREVAAVVRPLSTSNSHVPGPSGAG